MVPRFGHSIERQAKSAHGNELLTVYDETPSLGRGLLRVKSTVRVEVSFDGINVRDQGEPSSLWAPSVLRCPKCAMHE